MRQLGLGTPSGRSIGSFPTWLTQLGACASTDSIRSGALSERRSSGSVVAL